MPSLSDNFKVGTTSASSLVKSAATLQNQINTYNDDEAKIVFDNSAKTDADLATYQGYLQGRVTQLQGTGSVTDATKALTMGQDLISAQKSNISANVQRASIAVLAGNGTLQDKYDAMVTGYNQLVNVGDLSGAQTLEAQAYSLNQTIQTNAAAAATASATAASTLASAKQTNATNYIASMTDAIKTLNDNISQQGMGNFNKQQQANITQLEKSGVKLPQGAQSSYEDVVTSLIGVKDPTTASGYNTGSMLDMYMNTLKGLTPGTSQYNSVASSITNIENGTTKFAMYGKSLDYNQAITARDAAAAGNPLYVPIEGANGQTGFKAAQDTGVVWAKDQYGNDYQIQNTTAAKGASMSSDQKAALTKAGFQVVGTSNGGTEIQVTQANQHALNVKGTTVGTIFTVFATGTKANQFAFAANGSLYQMNVDNTGKTQLNQVNAPNAQGKTTMKTVSQSAGYTPPIDTKIPTAAQQQANAKGITNIKATAGTMDNNKSPGTTASVSDDVTSWVKDAGHAMGSLFHGVSSLIMGSDVAYADQLQATQAINAAHDSVVQQGKLQSQLMLAGAKAATVTVPTTPTPSLAIKAPVNPLASVATTAQVQNASTTAKVQNAGTGAAIQGGTSGNTVSLGSSGSGNTVGIK